MFTPLLGFPSRAALEAALEALPLPAYISDAGGILTCENATARRLFGDLRGTYYRSRVLPPEEVAPAKERFARALMGQTTSSARVVAVSVEGRRVPVEVSLAPLREEDRIIGVFGVAVPATSQPGPEAMTATLTPRQRQVLHAIAEGKSTTQIAEELHLAPTTVRNYVRAVLRALGARSRLEAVLIALREGIVSLDVRNPS
jgi:PAS domain S-box-containing protein